MHMQQNQEGGVEVDRIWLKSYPEGVPAEIDPDAYQSIVEVFEKSCAKYAERNAYYNLGQYITYKELDRYSRDFAAYLQNELKLEKGDRFAIMLPNVLQYPIAMFGAMRAGLVIVNVNPLYTSDELTYQLNNAGVKAMVTLTNFAHTVERSLPEVKPLKHIILSEVGDMINPVKALVLKFLLKYCYKVIPKWRLAETLRFKDVMKKGRELTFNPVSLVGSDTAYLQYTGGTTGVSKGAVLSHRNIIANIEQANAWLTGALTKEQEIIITALPMYHIFSLTANCIFFASIGGLNVLITNPRRIGDMIKEMAKFPFSALTGVNTLFNGLLKHKKFANLDFSHLRLTLGGGMAVQEAVAKEWHRVTGHPILEAYGLTETSPCVTVNPINAKEYNGSIGLPVPSTDVVILDDNGHFQPPGETGEIAIKGPQVMSGYWQSPEETAKVFTKDGWLLTGDVGYMDEKGYVRLQERKKDMILVSGFNVYPNEVEDVLMHLSGVRECAVIGVPDESMGERVKAFIVRDDEALDVGKVTSYCREHLTGYKVPKEIVFCDDLPKTNVGKILRRALREGGANSVQNAENL